MQRKYFYSATASVLVLLLLMLYLVKLHNTLTERFEGRRYVIPSRVYARPLELVQGNNTSKERLLFELRQLNYQNTKELDQPGTYTVSQNSIKIWKRGFYFEDGLESDLQFKAEWNKDNLNLTRFEGTRIDIPVRLDPIDIGGIYPRVIEDRILLKYSDVPEILRFGLPAVEDKSFFEHHGLKPTAILRAAIANIKAGRIVQGGSTLTQQLIKNLFLTSKQNFSRKIVEAIMALQLELSYKKEDILETYINEVYFGQNGSRSINGFGLASQRFFGKDISQLSVSEIATLVGMLKGPNYYDPRRFKERTIKRRNVVLGLWKNEGLIDNELYDESVASGLTVRPRVELSISKFPDFIGLVKRYLLKAYSADDLSGSGFKIFTSLDPFLQLRAERALRQQIRRYKSRNLVGAAVTVDAFDGGILTLVGKTDRQTLSYFNRALFAKRQIGSLIKPFVYLSALKSKYTLSTLLSDDPIEVKLSDGTLWSPDNYDDKSHGNIMLIDAMAKSYNRSTVRLGMEVGLEKVVDQAQALGLEKPSQVFPSFLLGTAELTPMNVAELYQPFASGGYKIPLSPVRSVLNRRGSAIKRYPIKVRSVLDENYWYLIASALRQVVKTGTSRSLLTMKKLDKIGGKTGTSQNERDAWFVGVGSKKLSVVWIGNDKNSPIGLTGASGALPVFRAMSKDIDYGDLLDQKPQSIIIRKVDQQGRLLSGGCEGRALPFLEDKLPRTSTECSSSSDWLKRIFN